MPGRRLPIPPFRADEFATIDAPPQAMTVSAERLVICHHACSLSLPATFSRAFSTAMWQTIRRGLLLSRQRATLRHASLKY
jgi:hypothetical protein